MDFNFKGRDIINGYDFTTQELCHIMDTAMIYEKRVKSGEAIKDMEGMLVATLFFEPSTRTRLSFNSAIQRMGASTIDLGSASASSQSKGETWQDTIRTVDGYVDAIVMRHLCADVHGLAAVVHTVRDEVDVVPAFILAEVGGIAAAGQHSKGDTMPLGGLHSIQLVLFTVFLLNIGLQGREVGVIVILHTAAAQANGQPVRGGAACVDQLVPGEQIVTLLQTQHSALLRHDALNGLGDLGHRVLALRYDLSLVLLLRRFRLLRGHGADGDAHIPSECAVPELHTANDVGTLHRRDTAPCFFAPLGVLAYLYLHRAGEEFRVVKRHGLHIVHPIDGDTAGSFILFVFAHSQRHTGNLICGQGMPFVGRQVQHICAVYAHFLKHPIGQIIPCWGVDGDAVSRRVSCRYHTPYQHQRQQKRRPIPHFSSHRGIPPASVYIAVFAWTETPPTRIGRLLP